MGIMTDHEIRRARARKFGDDHDAAYVAAIWRHGRAVGQPKWLTCWRVRRYLRREGYFAPSSRSPRPL